MLLLVATAVPGLRADLGCEGDWANSPICVEHRAAVAARAKAEALLENLPETAMPPWNPEEVATAQALYEEGLELYRDEYFGDATAQFNAAIEQLATIEAGWRELVAQRLAQANASLAAGDFDAAVAQFDGVLNLLPGSEEAAAGLSKANRGILARNAIAQANQSLARGNIDAAERHLEAVPAHLLTDRVAEVRRQIDQARRRNSLNRSMTRGFQHLDRDAWSDAEAAFTEALRTDPASVAAKDALEDVRRRRTNAEAAKLRDQLRVHVEAEDWVPARTVLRKLRELDPNSAAIDSELAHIRHLVDVEAGIEDLLSEPRHLSTKGVRDRAKALVDATTDPAIYGAKIIEKRNRLQQALTTWTTPIAITVRSDNRTEVRIRPGRALGKFRERRIEVLPGDYVLSGRRVGYREVSLRVAIPPGSEARTVRIVCNERF